MRRVILLVAIVLIVISMSTLFLYADDLETSKVYITIDGEKYVLKGTAVYKESNNEFIVDFKNKTFIEDNLNYDYNMANTLVITDLSYDKFDKETYIFATGLAFKANNVDFNDTSQYVNMKVNIGTPYVVMFSANITSKPAKIYNEAYGPTLYSPVYAAPFDTKFNEDLEKFNNSKDPYAFTYLYDFLSNNVQPRVIKSRYKAHTLYWLVEDADNTLKDERHVKVFEFKTDRSLFYKGNHEKYEECFFIKFWWLNDFGKEYDKDFKVNLSYFYVYEQDKDKLFLMNKGDNISIGIESDTSIPKQPKLIQRYWIPNDDLEKVINDIKK